MATTWRLSRPQSMGMVSALLAGIGALLSGGFTGAGDGGVAVDASAGGDPIAILTVLFAGLAVGLVLLGRFESREPVGVVGYGLTISALGSWQFLVVGGGAAPGIGVVLTLAGGIGLLAAGLWGYRTELTLDRSQRRARSH